MFTSPHKAISPVLERSNRPFRRLKRRVLHIAIIATAAVVAVAATPTLTVQAAAPRMIVGAAGDVSELSNRIDAPLAYHGYGQLSGSVPQARMINMKSTVNWRTLANATSGTTYNHLVRWAQTIKARPGPVMLAFHHEPEASGNTSYGSASDFIAAYRRVVDVFRKQGVTNVEYVWQMTSWAFAVNSGDRRAAAKWYPGDSYVDLVGTDPYNWYDCGSGKSEWVELKKVMDPSLVFARAHGKGLVVAEFASQSGSQRAQWLRNARQYFIANRATIRAVFYFHYVAHPACHWKLSTSADLAAMREMAVDATNFTIS